jgi:hypothetical protein
MPEDYMSFDDALKALQMQEAELRALVSQGKLRAFRDENTLKFRRADVEGLRKQRETEPTMVVQQPDDLDETAVPEPGEPMVTDEPVELFADETLDYDDTAETIIGGDLGALDTGDVDLSLEEPPAAANEPSTKVPTIELTAPDTSTGDTDVPTLDLGEATAGDIGSETEVPTMVLGLDDYDDTQVATEDVATEEVALEPGELGELEPTTDVDQAIPVEEEEAEAAVGRITASSSLGTGEPLAVREQPSALYTAMCGIAAFFLLIPGGMFFYCMITGQVPQWEFLRGIVRFFWDQFGVTPPTTPY